MIKLLNFFVLFVFCLYNVKTETCNEDICGSIVSKCLLIQSCSCKIEDCSCCKDCVYCMGHLFPECCNCLNLCPHHNDTFEILAPKSQVSDFVDHIPELYDTLTAGDEEDKWTTIRLTFNLKKTINKFVDKNASNNNNNNNIDDHYDHYDTFDDIDVYSNVMKQKGLKNSNEVSSNCTVIFLNRCLSNNKCLKFCSSMGAAKNRWFHDGCCECVGSTCLNYGLNENQCSECPDIDDNYDDEDDEYYSEEHYDYEPNETN